MPSSKSKNATAKAKENVAAKRNTKATPQSGDISNTENETGKRKRAPPKSFWSIDSAAPKVDKKDSRKKTGKNQRPNQAPVESEDELATATLPGHKPDTIAAPSYSEDDLTAMASPPKKKTRQNARQPRTSRTSRSKTSNISAAAEAEDMGDKDITGSEENDVISANKVARRKSGDKNKVVDGTKELAAETIAIQVDASRTAQTKQTKGKGKKSVAEDVTTTQEEPDQTLGAVDQRIEGIADHAQGQSDHESESEEEETMAGRKVQSLSGKNIKNMPDVRGSRPTTIADTRPRSYYHKHAPVATEEYEKLKIAFQQLQDRYESLKQTGVKEAEERFEQYKRTAEVQQKAYEDYNDRLKHDVETLREETESGNLKLDDLQRQLKRAVDKAAEAEEALKRNEAKAAAKSVERASNNQEKLPDTEITQKIETLEAEIDKIKEAEKTLEAEAKKWENNALSYKTELDSAKQQLTALKEDKKAQDAQISSFQQNERYVATLERMVKLFEELTGVTMESVEETTRPIDSENDPATEEPVLLYKCKQKGRHGVIAYNLMAPRDGKSTSTYTCEAIVRGDGGGQQNVPDWLREPIDFEQKMCAMFFWRMCDHLQKEH